MSVKGIINLNKPVGISSARAVSKVKKILNTGAVGHMGTLDPSAEGVLLVGVGKATRLFNYLLNKDKVYQACFEFGYETDTLDSEGVVVKTSEILPTSEQILKVLPSLIGVQMQIPPLYSAKNIDGVRCYELARKGLTVELKPSEITVFDILLTKSEGSRFWFDIHCSSGTYIRSICRDLASLVGSCATMIKLKRTRCGKYNIKDSVSFEDLEQFKERFVEDLSISLGELTRVDVPKSLKFKLDNGVKCKVEQVFNNSVCVVYCDNIMYGIGNIDSDNMVKITTYLKD